MVHFERMNRVIKLKLRSFSLCIRAALGEVRLFYVYILTGGDVRIICEKLPPNDGTSPCKSATKSC